MVNSLDGPVYTCPKHNVEVNAFNPDGCHLCAAERIENMVEVSQEQLNTINEIAATAVVMTRNAFSQYPQQSGAQAQLPAEEILPTSPLAAEIFKTLVRSHTQNKTLRLLKEAQEKMDAAHGLAGRGQVPYGGAEQAILSRGMI